MCGSGISWAISSRQITTPAPHRSVFLQARCPSCRPTNSVKALKALFDINISQILFVFRTVVNTRKHYLCVRFVEPWYNLNCATVDFSSLRRFKCFLRRPDLSQYLKHSGEQIAIVFPPLVIFDLNVLSFHVGFCVCFF